MEWWRNWKVVKCAYCDGEGSSHQSRRPRTYASGKLPLVDANKSKGVLIGET